MKRLIAVVLVCLFVPGLMAFAGLGGDKTAYVGGTENQIKDGAEGESSAKDDRSFVFQYKDGKLAIPYDQVNDWSMAKRPDADSGWR